MAEEQRPKGRGGCCGEIRGDVRREDRYGVGDMRGLRATASEYRESADS